MADTEIDLTLDRLGGYTNGAVQLVVTYKGVQQTVFALNEEEEAFQFCYGLIAGVVAQGGERPVFGWNTTVTYDVVTHEPLVDENADIQEM